MPLIELEDVCVYAPAPAPRLLEKLGLQRPPAYDPLLPPPILDHLSLHARPRETLAIVGASGSGKTTLLKVAAGLQKPDSGRVLHDGVDIRTAPVRQRRVGFVFQGQALYTNMTAQDNIGFYYTIRKQRQQIPQRVRDVARLMDVDLAPLLARKPPTLSGGERQRIAIARALAREVDIFLFDEPLAHLDVPLRNHLRVAMKRVFGLHPVTTLYVTHDRGEAMALGDRVALIHQGRIVQVGAAAELLERPANTFVASFFGEYNLLEGYIRDDQHWVLGEVRLPAPPAKAGVGDKIILGVRPGDFALDPQNGAMRVRVTDTFPLYERHIMQVHGRVEGHEIVFEAPLGGELGAEVRLTPTRWQWFAAKDGYRLRL